MAFGPQVRLWFSSVGEDGSLSHVAHVVSPELAAALARELAEAAMNAVEFAARRRPLRPVGVA